MRLAEYADSRIGEMGPDCGYGAVCRTIIDYYQFPVTEALIDNGLDGFE
jgi:hypothetical protein